MDVGESPIGETKEYCAALEVPGTMALCQRKKTTMRQIEGGNRGVGFSVPICDHHAAMFDTDPASIEVSIQGVPPQ